MNWMSWIQPFTKYIRSALTELKNKFNRSAASSDIAINRKVTTGHNMQKKIILSWKERRELFQNLDISYDNQKITSQPCNIATNYLAIWNLVLVDLIFCRWTTSAANAKEDSASWRSWKTTWPRSKAACRYQLLHHHPPRRTHAGKSTPNCANSNFKCWGFKIKLAL